MSNGDGGNWTPVSVVHPAADRRRSSWPLTPAPIGAGELTRCGAAPVMRTGMIISYGTIILALPGFGAGARSALLW